MDAWTYSKTGYGIAGTYHLNGWEVWCNGDAWKITRPDDFTYAIGYKMVGSAKAFAEREMNEKSKI